MNSYGTLLPAEYSPAVVSTEPLPLDTVKDFLNLPVLSEPDTGKDAELDVTIAASREIAEEECGHDIKLKQWVLTYDCWPCEFRLRYPLSSVHLVRYRDDQGDWTNLVADTDYILDERKNPPIMLPATYTSWPTATLWPSGAIEIYFSSGYSDETLIPNKLKQGMLMLIRAWFDDDDPAKDEIAAYRLLRGSPRP